MSAPAMRSRHRRRTARADLRPRTSAAAAVGDHYPRRGNVFDPIPRGAVASVGRPRRTQIVPRTQDESAWSILVYDLTVHSDFGILRLGLRSSRSRCGLPRRSGRATSRPRPVSSRRPAGGRAETMRTVLPRLARRRNGGVPPKNEPARR